MFPSWWACGAAAVNTGKWEDPHGTKLFLALERKGNALGFSSGDRDKFVAKERLPIFDGAQEYCLWLGCMGAYDPRGREIIASFARVMEHLGTSYGVLRKERCTGDPARRLGNDLLFDTLATSNLETLAQAKVTKIVSICPHCVRTISTDWPASAGKPEIEHHSEFLARHRERLPQPWRGRRSRITIRVTWAATAALLRPEPRAVIEQSGEHCSEAERSREPRSFCCGAGGGLAFLGEETGRTGEPREGQGIDGDGRGHRRRGVPLLQYHVSRCPARRLGKSAAAAGYRGNRCGLAPAFTAAVLPLTFFPRGG